MVLCGAGTRAGAEEGAGIGGPGWNGGWGQEPRRVCEGKSSVTCTNPAQPGQPELKQHYTAVRMQFALRRGA